jgi:hypothetical protein
VVRLASSVAFEVSWLLLDAWISDHVPHTAAVLDPLTIACARFTVALAERPLLWGASLGEADGAARTEAEADAAAEGDHEDDAGPDDGLPRYGPAEPTKARGVAGGPKRSRSTTGAASAIKPIVPPAAYRRAFLERSKRRIGSLGITLYGPRQALSQNGNERVTAAIVRVRGLSLRGARLAG